MKKSETPSMRLIKLEEEMAKYKPENEKIEPDNVRKFVDDFLSGNLKVPYFLSRKSCKRQLLLTLP